MAMTVAMAMMARLRDVLMQASLCSYYLWIHPRWKEDSLTRQGKAAAPPTAPSFSHNNRPALCALLVGFPSALD